MDDDKHYPGQPEAETPADEPETPAQEGEPEPEGDDTPEPGDKSEDAPEPEKDKEGDEEPPVEPIKKRSIYDDLKDERKERKSAETRAAEAEAKAADLQALLDAKGEATTPEEKKAAAKDIAEYAEKHKLDPDSLEELSNIILSKAPKAEGTLTPEEAAEWRAERARAKQTEEDQAIMATAPSVKAELGITNDTELANVMKEVVRLAHTAEFHDKEPEYIVWRKKDALSKLVSPKRPSFEQGGQREEGAADTEPDFSSGQGITPEMAGRAASQKRGSSMEVRRGSQVVG